MSIDLLRCSISGRTSCSAEPETIAGSSFGSARTCEHEFAGLVLTTPRQDLVGVHSVQTCYLRYARVRHNRLFNDRPFLFVLASSRSSALSRTYDLVVRGLRIGKEANRKWHLPWQPGSLLGRFWRFDTHDHGFCPQSGKQTGDRPYTWRCCT